MESREIQGPVAAMLFFFVCLSRRAFKKKKKESDFTRDICLQCHKKTVTFVPEPWNSKWQFSPFTSGWRNLITFLVPPPPPLSFASSRTHHAPHQQPRPASPVSISLFFSIVIATASECTVLSSEYLLLTFRSWFFSSTSRSAVARQVSHGGHRKLNHVHFSTKKNHRFLTTCIVKLITLIPIVIVCFPCRQREIDRNCSPCRC